MSLTEFTEWLAREMPPGTVIGDPRWWAPRIAARFAAGQQGAGEVVADNSEINGLTSKQAWWAGARAGLGVPDDMPRTEVARRLATPQLPKPAGLCTNCAADGRCMKRQALCVANGTADAKPAVADPLSDNPQPLPANPSLSDKGAVTLPETVGVVDFVDGAGGNAIRATLRRRLQTGAELCAVADAIRYGDARAEHAALTMAADILEKCPRCIDAREAAALIQSSCCNICNKCGDGAGRADAVPAGYVVVPLEPTPEMILEGRDRMPYAIGPGRASLPEGNLEHSYYAYKAMLAASPKPPAAVTQQMTTQGEALPRPLKDLLHFTEHCISAAEEGVEYATSREWLDAMTTIGVMEKVGRGKWAPTDHAEAVARRLTGPQS